MGLQLRFLLIPTLFYLHLSSGIKLETIKKCCEIGKSLAENQSKCNNIKTPIDGVIKSEETHCLKAADACCKKEYREKQCIRGQDDARNGQQCYSPNENEGEYRKDCCEACELGLEAGAASQSCISEFELGESLNAVFTQCCKNKASTTDTPTSTEAVKNNYDADNPPPTPALEDVCDLLNPCSHVCKPQGSSYKCGCYAGFKLAPDGNSCKPIRRFDPYSARCGENNPCEHECIDTGVAIRCACFEGYELGSDKTSCKDIDECTIDTHDCNGSEICINLEGDYACQESDNPDLTNVGFDDKCPEGYRFNGERKVCDDVNECEIELVCPQPSICVNTIGSFECKEVNTPQCPPGFRFRDSTQACEDLDECTTGENDCNRESQVCLNTKGNYTCIDKASKKTCPPGFKKNQFTQNCEDINECEENPKACKENEECINELGGHNCIPGQTTPKQTVYSQTTTSITQRPTQSKPQQPSCPSGFKFNDQYKICVDIDECLEVHVCDSNQDCYNTQGSFICNCKTGFTKDYQTGACVDINECQLGQHECTDAQRCDNTVGSYLCARITGCGTGYTLNLATGLCEDDDECIIGSHNCAGLGPKFECRNTLGSYRCERIRTPAVHIPTWVTPSMPQTTPAIEIPVKPTTPISVIDPRTDYPVIVQHKKCLPGYRMNIQGICEDINECDSNPCGRGQKCLNLNGRYQCISHIQCRSGYELNEAGDGCIDINECSRGTHKCTNTQICKNGLGYYTCQCPPGHKLNRENDCEDINECEYYRGRICSVNSECINTIGSYRCRCKDGFREKGQSCDDIDECVENPGLCQHTCVNIWGSYRCSCDSGFTLNSDNRTCTDVDECEKFKDRKLCVGPCINTPGSYTCKCPDGYRLGVDERTCQDIDECQRNPCRNSDEICFNIRGSYKCHLITCPSKYIKDPEHKSRCKRASNVCDIRDLDCIRMPEQYSYHFVTFVSNLPIPDEGRIDFFQMKGPAWIKSSADFTMNLVDVQCPRHVERADESYFRMKRDTNKVVLSVVRPIEGPQEVQLQLQMELYINGIFQGKVISNIFVFVSQYSF